MSAVNSESYRYYHAGALFNLKELAGNAMLAEAIRIESSGRYQATLPQDVEVNPPTSIRDADLLALLASDIALFHFDGAELDSGTVAEFMVAKFADIPAVILRSDFRNAGDSSSDAWNLMLSDYPRTQNVVIHAMDLYHRQRHADATALEAAERASRETARRVIAAFDDVQQQPPVLSPDLRGPVYRWLAHFPRFQAPVKEIEQKLGCLLEAKLKKRLL